MARASQAASGTISPEGYLEAAKDHAAVLHDVYFAGHYAVAIYLAGLAAECVFRAFRVRRGMAFTSDHSLENLAREAGFADLVPQGDRHEFDAALAALVVGWRNSHRFRSNAALKRFLKRQQLDRGIKGDYLKERTRRLTSNAIQLVQLGVDRWPLSKT